MSISKEEEIYGKVKNFVDNGVKESESSIYFDVYNPAFGKVIAQVPDSTTEEVRHAIDSAQEAFEKWRKVPVTERIKYLFRLENLMRQKREDLARMVTTEHGKTYSEALAEVDRAIENIESACSFMSLIFSRIFLPILASCT